MGKIAALFIHFDIMSSTTFDDCKSADLRHTAMILGEGALLAIDVERQVIVAVSQNIATWLGQAPDAILGKSAAELLGQDWPGLQALAELEGRHQIAALHLPGHEQPCHVAAHRCNGRLIYEIKAFDGTTPAWWSPTARMDFLQTLSATTTVPQCIALLVDEVAKHTGLDRVMAYRFLPDWHGEVIHEACRPGIDGFLGLRFPASDLPANARELYTLNWHRTIADLEQHEVPLRLLDGEPSVDLTYSLLRAVHPAHIQYLRNMGVQASLSLSLIVNGQLWGLVACHHMTPLGLGLHARLALEEMARLVSLHLANLLRLAELTRQSRLREQLSRINGMLTASGESPFSGIAKCLPHLRKLFHADSAWLHFEGQNQFIGPGSLDESFQPLQDWILQLDNQHIHHYACLPESLQDHPALTQHASGLLHIPLGDAGYLLLLRQEVVHVVNWAGAPKQGDAATQPLTPRHSFALWSEQVRNSATPWHDSEIQLADDLHKSLNDYIRLTRLEQIAMKDPLTGLANRLLFNRHLQQACEHDDGSPFAIHMLDLDRFKTINDSMGHAAGDALLQQVAQRLMRLIRNDDIAARLGGDEFAIIQPTLSNPQAATALAARIVKEISRPYLLQGREVEVSASVGIALFPQSAKSKEQLLHLADIALYNVKKQGRNGFSLYSPPPSQGRRELIGVIIRTSFSSPCHAHCSDSANNWKSRYATAQSASRSTPMPGLVTVSNATQQ